MPSGKVHNLINTTTYSVLAGCAYYGYSIRNLPLELTQVIAFSVPFWVGTLLLSPDLDLADQQNVDSKKAWGVLGFLWKPYGILFSHRGLSHSWILGPLSRLIYLGLILFLPLLLLWFFAPRAINWSNLTFRSETGFILLIGYYFSQWLHLLADGVFPGHSLRILFRTQKKGKKIKRRSF